MFNCTQHAFCNYNIHTGHYCFIPIICLQAGMLLGFILGIIMFFKIESGPYVASVYVNDDIARILGWKCSIDCKHFWTFYGAKKWARNLTSVSRKYTISKYSQEIETMYRNSYHVPIEHGYVKIERRWEDFPGEDQGEHYTIAKGEPNERLVV